MPGKILNILPRCLETAEWQDLIEGNVPFASPRAAREAGLGEKAAPVIHTGGDGWDLDLLLISDEYRSTYWHGS